MKAAKANRNSERSKALHALKHAILEGATAHYEHLVAAAVQAGVTDEEIDGIVHEALEALFASAEQPVTPRLLDHVWSAAHFRH